ncbi:MAG: hypothetical protein A2X70_00530 [Alphaproteobacteria bacterium GWC2_42_16]|nr:MAG: hypothetical protein A2X70_00530 [Alphaproteobacteria bacterium GWC2_42_16]OFW82091.1 MAG: hypothetical protein A3E50_06590 [Alphaproteobacteria bacterium RIFCSPHIGHO2_12_FULL_42_100]OFW86332.1 MAG: hypothetical protein A2W06_03260 [Alphaproteobacteria bacterium RBG_16_42_14]OFW91232.1 MAG: hypothetical protein A3C41_06230 [Alphaproteobacteria bacterium RIFCSPHIGHO2_02_FULL_42_30]OFX05280.1 MAG: hypothetical protein A3H46_06245 [Alphaproteobacteria bacterium RIFCSPLOWO2_02_FULL_43_54]O
MRGAKSAEAIQKTFVYIALDCFAPLAMTEDGMLFICVETPCLIPLRYHLFVFPVSPPPQFYSPLAASGRGQHLHIVLSKKGDI